MGGVPYRYRGETAELDRLRGADLQDGPNCPAVPSRSLAETVHMQLRPHIICRSARCSYNSVQPVLFTPTPPTHTHTHLCRLEALPYVEVRRRLVDHVHIGLLDRDRGDGKALQLPTRKVLDIAVRHLTEGQRRRLRDEGRVAGGGKAETGPSQWAQPLCPLHPLPRSRGEHKG